MDIEIGRNADVMLRRRWGEVRSRLVSLSSQAGEIRGRPMGSPAETAQAARDMAQGVQDLAGALRDLMRILSWHLRGVEEED